MSVFSKDGSVKDAVVVLKNPKLDGDKLTFNVQVTQANSDSWMIGDTEADLLAGIAMQIPTIALTCGIRSKKQLSQFKPTLIKDDLLCAAHHLVGINSLQVCG